MAGSFKTGEECEADVMNNLMVTDENFPHLGSGGSGGAATNTRPPPATSQATSATTSRKRKRSPPVQRADKDPESR